MQNKFYKIGFKTAFVGVIMTLLSGAAYAGFEYVPAPGAAAPASGTPQQAPVNDVTMTPMPGQPAPIEPIAAQPLQPAITNVPAQPQHVLQAPPQTMPTAQPLLKVKTVTPTAQTQPPQQAAQQFQATQPVNDGANIIPAPTELTPPTAAQTQARMDVQGSATPAPVQQPQIITPPPVQQAVAPAPLAQPPAQRAEPPQIIWNPAPAKRAEAPKQAAVEATQTEPAQNEIKIEKIESAPVKNANADEPLSAEPQIAKDTGETTHTPRTRISNSDEIFEGKAKTSSNERRPEGLVIPPDVKTSESDIKIEKPVALKEEAGQEIPTQEEKPKKLVINPYPQGNNGAPVSGKYETAPETNTTDATDLASAANASGDFPNVVGFGSDMPLALAVQQIAPTDYIFSFNPGVNPGTRVSWDGGNKPWDQVLADTIAPLGLKARIDGKIVHISGDGTSVPGKQASLDARPGNPVPLKDENIHRANIVDPGESSKAQPLSTLASMEEAASEQAAIQPAAEETAPQQAVPLLPEEQAAHDAGEQKISATTEQNNILEGTVPGVRGTWAVRQGDSLKETLNEWSKQANVDLVWNATHDYTVDADITVNDTFQSAVGMVVDRGVKVDKPAFKFEGETLTVSDKT